MAYVNVEEWTPEQVAAWVRGLGPSVQPNVNAFIEKSIGGKQLLQLSTDILDDLGMKHIGSQEIVMHALEQLAAFHYLLDRENLQWLAVLLSVRATSLIKELHPLSRSHDMEQLPTRRLAGVAFVVDAAKNLLFWMERSPFEGRQPYNELQLKLLKLVTELSTQAVRERFAEKPILATMKCCECIRQVAEKLVQSCPDPLALQPSHLQVATLRRRRAGEDLGLQLDIGPHVGVACVKGVVAQSPAHVCARVEAGDEIVQVNYQTVVGWETEAVAALLSSPGGSSPSTEILLTFKRRPRSNAVSYGHMYIRPFRLPSQRPNNHAPPVFPRWGEPLAPLGPLPVPRILKKKPNKILPCTPTTPTPPGSDSEVFPEIPILDEDQSQEINSSLRLYLPRPRPLVQRRATVTGASPTHSRPPVDLQELLGDSTSPTTVTLLTPSPTPISPLSPVSLVDSQTFESQSSLQRRAQRLGKSQSTPAYEDNAPRESHILQRQKKIDSIIENKELTPSPPVPRPRKISLPGSIQSCTLPRSPSVCSDGGPMSQTMGSPGTVEGWLERCQRHQQGGILSGARWFRRWFVLKRHLLQGYKEHGALRPESLLHLPGYTFQRAPEVKGRKYAFRLTNGGSSFVFAADSEEQLNRWEMALNQLLGKVTSCASSISVPSPGRRPSAPSSCGYSLTKTHSSPNLPPSTLSNAGNSTTQSSPLRSLLALGNRVRPQSPQPVPTARFRSYRRVTHGENIPPLKADAYLDNSPEQRWLRSLRDAAALSNIASGGVTSLTPTSLKSTALYQPHVIGPRALCPAFEMSLDPPSGRPTGIDAKPAMGISMLMKQGPIAIPRSPNQTVPISSSTSTNQDLPYPPVFQASTYSIGNMQLENH